MITKTNESLAMKKVKQPGFFDITERTEKLTQLGDPLVELKARINWEAFRPDLSKVYEKHVKAMRVRSLLMWC